MTFKLLSKAALALAAMGLCLSAASAAYKSEYKLSVVPAPPPAGAKPQPSLPTASDRNPTAESTSNRISVLS